MTDLILNTGYKMPIFGLGTWLSNPGEVGKAVEIALTNGYRLLDCAYAYQNQEEIGQVLKKLFDKGSINREDIFITSKVWNTFHSYDLALKNVDKILDELQIDYLDLCLIHWPTGFKEGGEIFPRDPNDNNKILFSDVDYLETWKALEVKVKEGKIRSIGLSNFGIKQIDRIIQNSEIKPSALQVELHPYFQQRELIDYCKVHSICVTAYSPLGNPAMPFRKEGDPNVLHDPKIAAIAQKHGKTNAQIVLKALIQKGISVIPKSVNEARIIENARIWDFSLEDEELKTFEALDQNRRLLDLKGRDGHHPHFPW